MVAKSLLHIDQMFAFVADNEGVGEGVMACSLPIEGQMMMTPLVGADMDRIRSYLPIAKSISEATGRKFKILKFSQREDITEDIMSGGIKCLCTEN